MTLTTNHPDNFLLTKSWAFTILWRINDAGNKLMQAMGETLNSEAQPGR